ncbi:MAG: polysaccharide biosynthesis tyrosine autokinase [Paludibacteraceae bacterium]|nr:polysaccharide biosynthesis tyrosine autokinase [Paludibacteraceae bacterium]
MEQTTNNTTEIDLRKIVRLVLHKWYWFVIGLVACVLIGVWYLVRTTPKVTTQASIMLRQRDEGLGAGQLDQLSMLGIGGNRTAEDELVVLSSKDLMLQVINQLDLMENHWIKLDYRWEGEYPKHTFRLECLQLSEDGRKKPFTLDIKPTRKGYKIKSSTGFGETGSVEVRDFTEPIDLPVGRIRLTPIGELQPGARYRIQHRTVPNAIVYYSSILRIAQHKRESNIFDLSVRSTMPGRDADLLNALISNYNSNTLTDKNMIATNTADFIQSRLEIISAELSAAEDAVEQYKSEHNMANLGEEAKLLLQSGAEDQKQLAEVETQLSWVNYIAEFLRDKNNQHSLLPTNVSVQDEALAAYIAEYNETLLRYMRMQRTAVEGSPVLDQINADLSNMRANIVTSVTNVREGLLITKAGLEMRQNELMERIQRVPTQEREYVQLARQRQLKESLYMLLYKKREENALMLAAAAMPTKTIDIPRTDPESASPKPIRIIVLCLLLGLMLPAGLLYLYVLLDNKIRDPKEFEKRLKVPYLGQIVANSRGKHIAIREGETTVSAELFRLLRTNLRFVVPADVKNPVVLVTSSVNGEGKSYVATNVALSLAILGKRVALVGLDVRKPMLAHYFGLQQQGCLTSYLAEDSYSVDDLIVPSGEHRNLDIIPCGVVPPNPNELLQSERLDQLFAALRERYDYIIVDTAPCALVSDTFLLDRVADVTLYVCRANYTTIDMIDSINQMADQKRMKQLCCVLNAVKNVRAGYGYGYGVKK